MRVICAYTDLHPLTFASLKQYAPQTEFFELNANPESYYWLLREVWEKGETFLNVEQDNEIHARVIPRLETCPRPWCLYPYKGDSRHQDKRQLLNVALGCTRFDARLMRRHPDLIANLPTRRWDRLDCHILPALTALRYRPHVHYPEVHHHHVYHGDCACGQKHPY